MAVRGPQAVPGTYRVRLTADKTVVEQPVEVRLDPVLKVSVADLKTQFDYVMKLREMQNRTVDSLKALDSIQGQLDQLDKTAKERNPELAKKLAAILPGYSKQIAAVSEKLARPADASRLSSTPRLLEDLSGLANGMDGVNAAPTGPQIALFGELERDFRVKIAEAEALVQKSLPEWNEVLKRLGAPSII